MYVINLFFPLRLLISSKSVPRLKMKAFQMILPVIFWFELDQAPFCRLMPLRSSVH